MSDAHRNASGLDRAGGGTAPGSDVEAPHRTPGPGPRPAPGAAAPQPPTVPEGPESAGGAPHPDPVTGPAHGDEGPHPESAPVSASAAESAPGPAPLGVVRTPTGLPAVDALLDRLGDADHLTADGHLDVYEDVHQGLRAELTALDERPGPRPYDNRS
ncbi:hypothetical protein [Streptomyces roseoviridis]|uniref:Uncharacterized protein n=1 Tax=Streptomyces roseoviridis TaxID=67361 RepID=A0ABV5QHJ0_9ACTN